MPVIENSHYRPPFLMRNAHVQTIYPSLFRRVGNVLYRRERIETPDGDFLDLDWQQRGTNRLVIIAHGLEGSSQRAYVKGMVRAFWRRGWDALAWNLRGCGGELNRKPQFYHSGLSEDLATVISHVETHYRYPHLALVGFSMGGNITLKYLGEMGGHLSHRICAAVAISVPCHLASSARKLDECWRNRLYLWRFLRMLKTKVRQKARLYPETFSLKKLSRVRSFRQFDDWFTAPLHGFASAQDYWRKASCLPWLPEIACPTLLLNARDDPFLTPECYPVAEAKNHPRLWLEMPRHGGHVGFVLWNRDGIYWSEQRAIEFVCQHLPAD